MLTTRHPVDFAYTHQEIQALFRYANDHDVEKDGRYDARSAAINIWSHHWAHPATREESETIGTFDVHWDPPRFYEIETDEGFSLEDLPSLAPELEALAAWAYPRARHDAAQETGLPRATFPEVCPWAIEQVLAEDFWPEA
jgi:hypothetical protein